MKKRLLVGLAIVAIFIIFLQSTARAQSIYTLDIDAALVQFDRQT